jgi:predicted MPP superfamily phosphohydrolase
MPTIAILGLLHLYVGWRIAPQLPTVGLAAAYCLLLLGSLLLIPRAFGGRRSSARDVADRWTWVGMTALGTFSLLLVLTVLRDVVLLLALPFTLPSLAQHSALAVPLLALSGAALGFYGARRTAAVREVALPIAGLPPALHGFTIVQVSDLHVGPTVKRDYVQRIADVVDTLDADVVALTGDLVDGRVQDLHADLAPLTSVRSRHGTYFVTGNHEYYSGVAEWTGWLRQQGVRVLDNEHVVIDHDGARLVLGGVADFSASHVVAAHRSDPQAALRGAPPDAALRVLLAHQPRSAPAAEAAGFDVQLSGHTHGGQFWPWNHFVRLQQPYTAGLHRLGKLWVYTSRGTGYWGPPLRLGAPSEITRLRLVGA